MINYYKGAVADFVQMGRKRETIVSNVEHYLTSMQVLPSVPFLWICLDFFNRASIMNGALSIGLLILILSLLNARCLKKLDLDQAYKKEWHYLIWRSRVIVLVQVIMGMLGSYGVLDVIESTA